MRIDDDDVEDADELEDALEDALDLPRDVIDAKSRGSFRHRRCASVGSKFMGFLLVPRLERMIAAGQNTKGAGCFLHSLLVLLESNAKHLFRTPV